MAKETGSLRIESALHNLNCLSKCGGSVSLNYNPSRSVPFAAWPAKTQMARAHQCPDNWKRRNFRRVRRLLLLGLLLGVIAFAWIGWQRQSPVAERRALLVPTVIKQPALITTRSFDPANPPADMPPMPSSGEIAQCESNFTANANVGGQPRRTDATHAVVTVSQIHVTLQLQITIWTPVDVSQRVMEHEQGHRQISEYYYQGADKLADEIASRYMGREVGISGADLDAEANKALQDIGAEITGEYDKALNPNPAQLLYDSITDHSRNDVAVQDAVDHALKNVSVEGDQGVGESTTQNQH
jgi:hypothetical protein